MILGEFFGKYRSLVPCEREGEVRPSLAWAILQRYRQGIDEVLMSV